MIVQATLVDRFVDAAREAGWSAGAINGGLARSVSAPARGEVRVLSRAGETLYAAGPRQPHGAGAGAGGTAGVPRRGHAAGGPPTRPHGALPTGAFHKQGRRRQRSLAAGHAGQPAARRQLARFPPTSPAAPRLRQARNAGDAATAVGCFRSLYCSRWSVW